MSRLRLEATSLGQVFLLELDDEVYAGSGYRICGRKPLPSDPDPFVSYVLDERDANEIRVMLDRVFPRVDA